MEKRGGWSWILSSFHCKLIFLLEWNTKIPIFPGGKDSMELWDLWGLSFFPLSGFLNTEGEGRVVLINIFFFSPCLSVFLWDGHLIKISVLSQACSGVSTPEIFCWLSLCKIHVGNLGVLSERWQKPGGRRRFPPWELRQAGECICAAPAQPKFLSDLPCSVSSRRAAETGVAEVFSEFFLTQWDAAVPKAGQVEGAALSSVPGWEQQCKDLTCLVLCCTHEASWPASRFEWIPPKGPPSLHHSLIWKSAYSLINLLVLPKVSSVTGMCP